MLKIRRPLGRLIFNMGIAIPGKTVFLIETAPSLHVHGVHAQRLFSPVNTETELSFLRNVVTEWTGSCQNGNIMCGQWWKFRRNDDVSVLVNWKWEKIPEIWPTSWWFFGENICLFSIIPQHWDCAGIWCLSTSKRGTGSSYRVNAVAADGLATQGARSPATKVLTPFFWNSPVCLNI